MMANAAAVALGCAATIPHVTSVAPSGPGRSCDGVSPVAADTILDSKDPLLRNVQPTGSRLTPRYPVDMREAGISGEVIASFVVDTIGNVPRGGAWIHSETRTSFGDAVCGHLKTLRFSPLVVNGKPVSVRVTNWPTSFDIRR
jgi:outer membrane biosynthesis protein TonB